MDMRLQKSRLPPSCTPPPQRGSAHGAGGGGKPRTPRKHLDPVQEGRGSQGRSTAPAGSPQSGRESREYKQAGGGEVFRESSQGENKD